MKVLTVFGTRPEAIKMAPVVKAMEGDANIQSIVCVTAQHREMLDQALEIFSIRPDYDLDVMSRNQTLDGLTARILEQFGKVLDDCRPDLVLVHGDTTTTFASSLAAFYRKIAVGHVEAGLRSGDPYSPWPEEMNRRLTGQLSSLHFAPTARARQNLLAEGVAKERIFVTGNSIVDALLEIRDRIEASPELRAEVEAELPAWDRSRKMILVTAHRREAHGEGIGRICEALARLAARGDTEIVYPVHLNPNIRDIVMDRLSDKPNIHLLPPISYLTFVHAMSEASLILTDSGGIQEEAPSFGTPVLVLRDRTERPEAIEAGVARLVGMDPGRIVSAAEEILSALQGGEVSPRKVSNPFGDGQAAERIRKAIWEVYG